ADRGAPLVRSLVAPLVETEAAVAMIEIDDLALKLQAKSEEERGKLVGQASDWLRQYALNRQAGMLLPERRGRFVLLVTAPGERRERLLQELVREAGEQLPFTVTVGIGRPAQSEEELPVSYRQAQAALSAKWLLGKNRLIRG